MGWWYAYLTHIAIQFSKSWAPCTTTWTFLWSNSIRNACGTNVYAITHYVRKYCQHMEHSEHISDLSAELCNTQNWTFGLAGNDKTSINKLSLTANERVVIASGLNCHYHDLQALFNSCPFPDVTWVWSQQKVGHWLWHQSLDLRK